MVSFKAFTLHSFSSFCNLTFVFCPNVASVVAILWRTVKKCLTAQKTFCLALICHHRQPLLKIQNLGSIRDMTTHRIKFYLGQFRYKCRTPAKHTGVLRLTQDNQLLTVEISCKKQPDQIIENVIELSRYGLNLVSINQNGK